MNEEQAVDFSKSREKLGESGWDNYSVSCPVCGWTLDVYEHEDDDDPCSGASSPHGACLSSGA